MQCRESWYFFLFLFFFIKKFSYSSFFLKKKTKQKIFQSNPYELEVDPEYYGYCDKPVYIQDEARLYKYSLLCEPRATGENEPPVRLVDKWRGESEKLGWIERWTKDL